MFYPSVSFLVSSTLDGGPCFEKLLPVSDSRPNGIQGQGQDCRAYTRKDMTRKATRSSPAVDK